MRMRWDRKWMRKANEIFGGSAIQITTDEKRHLEASLGSDKYKDEYVAFKVDWMGQELDILLEIAKTQPQSAYSFFYHRIQATIKTTVVI